jgi:hypothetical protein
MRSTKTQHQKHKKKKIVPKNRYKHSAVNKNNKREWRRRDKYGV